VCCPLFGFNGHWWNVIDSTKCIFCFRHIRLWSVVWVHDSNSFDYRLQLTPRTCRIWRASIGHYAPYEYKPHEFYHEDQCSENWKDLGKDKWVRFEIAAAVEAIEAAMIFFVGCSIYVENCISLQDYAIILWWQTLQKFRCMLFEVSLLWYFTLLQLHPRSWKWTTNAVWDWCVLNFVEYYYAPQLDHGVVL